MSKQTRTYAAIFQAHIDFVLDPYAIETIENNIKNNKYTAEYAVNSFYTEFANTFANMDDEYMKERSSDVKDVLKKYYMH
ncbi:phosphoenolpyruvate-utilizing N-terminal domain-containing protein [Mycoplasmopsis felis]|uniref:phosphoenolpyruvate-utilizing N-terminal domain-containing protein n=1 Tax=Mycoplasmopsis felis TaxID=33923 RepID=UPI003A5C850E